MRSGGLFCFRAVTAIDVTNSDGGESARQAGSDLVAEGHSVLVTLRSVGDEAPNLLRWIPFEPAIETTWYMNWSREYDKTPALTAAIAAARTFASSSGWR